MLSQKSPSSQQLLKQPFLITCHRLSSCIIVLIIYIVLQNLFCSGSTLVPCLLHPRCSDAFLYCLFLAQESLGNFSALLLR